MRLDRRSFPRVTTAATAACAAGGDVFAAEGPAVTDSSWFDSPYSLDLRGPHNSVTTDMAGFQFPWEPFTVAAKTG